MNAFSIAPVGDASITLDFPPTIDESIAMRCAAIAGALRLRRLPAIYDIVPAFHSVAVHFDPLATTCESIEAVLRECADGPFDAAGDTARVVEVPVQYGGEHGPDLPAVAAFGRCTEEEVVRLHSERVYRVFMLGFLPGFAYMGEVDRRIAAPRLDAPRAHVAAGSVGIAGRQTAVYPLDSPGGWQIIGRTSVEPFVAGREEPFLFRPADRIRFVRVD
jgi:KipI family sensor histidine kinase inhibitor